MSVPSEAQLREQLSGIDQQTAAAVAAAESAAAQHEAAMATAGQEFEPQIAAGVAAFNATQSAYNQFLADVQSGIDAVDNAVALIDAIEPVPPAGEIPTTGAPDCAAADVTNALLATVTAVNQTVEQIKAALTALNEAAQGLKQVAQDFKNNQPPGADSEAAKAAAYSALEGFGAGL